MNTVYDTGVLISAERNDRNVWAEHRVRLELALVPIATAPVVAQASRSSRQVQLRRLLRGCEIVAFAPDQAHTVGALLAASRTSDVVDAHVATVASQRHAIVVTSDPDDLQRLSRHLADKLTIERI